MAEKKDRYSDSEISQMFSDYVTRMEDKPRHTKAAIKEVDAFDTYCESEFPRNVRVQNGLYERMMNAAVEYEESGFIAGFKTAMALMSGNDELLPTPVEPHGEAEKAQEQTISSQINNSSSKEEKSQHEAVTASKTAGTAAQEPTADESASFRKNPPNVANFAEDNDHVNTVQIAEMFGTTNFKVVRRIETKILPFCDEKIKEHFIRVEGYNIQHKRCTFYRLDSVACRLYLDELEPKKRTYINIAGGVAKMQELMQKLFPTERLALPA